MRASTLVGRLLATLLLSAGVAAHAEGCTCSSDGVKRVTYIVVEMPEQEPESFPVYSTLPPSTTLQTVSTPKPTGKVAAQAAHVIEDTQDVPTYETFAAKPENLRPAENVTHTFGPTADPNVDTRDPINLVPAKTISLQYSAAETEQQGSINMTLALNNPAVVLEQVDAVKSVVCGGDELTVTFSDPDSFNEAVKGWSDSEEGFILITNHLGNCDAEFERGFFLATDLTSDEAQLSITVAASKEDLQNIAGECEMSFSSLPAATLSKRLTLDPTLSITVSEGLDDNTVIFSDGQYVNVTATEAWFSSTVTFSGYLRYNFWGFKLQALHFDLDTSFDAAVGVSVDVAAAFKQTIRYAPDELAYSFVSVPGLVQLGPGVAFAVGLDLDVSAAVGVAAGLNVAMPAANVHLDLVDHANSAATGWEPEYSSYANVTEAADARVDASADLTVQLAVELFGGLVDLSSGLTATPGFDNVFRLRGQQDLGLAGNFTGKAAEMAASLPKDGLVCAEQNGVEFKTEFYFKLTAFATKWWDADLYNVRVPLWDLCQSF
ncbi:hypothetical protein C8034_v000034 [Colletotrichum sidae]|uniref:DUF7029 domain-containing protein n=1 Tax=Colletotrichum sidae TaxID=1347389 RepID=A0A4R8SM44_9PEZI|nr:hypothetical protein C8034_v000034 [Colletotrichum sidae]